MKSWLLHCEEAVFDYTFSLSHTHSNAHHIITQSQHLTTSLNKEQIITGCLLNELYYYTNLCILTKRGKMVATFWFSLKQRLASTEPVFQGPGLPRTFPWLWKIPSVSPSFLERERKMLQSRFENETVPVQHEAWWDEASTEIKHHNTSVRPQKSS